MRAVATALVGTALLLSGCGGSTEDAGERAGASGTSARSGSSETAASTEAVATSDQLSAEDFEAALLPASEVDPRGMASPAGPGLEGDDPFGWGVAPTEGALCLDQLPVYPGVELSAGQLTTTETAGVNQYLSQSTIGATALDPDNMRGYWRSQPCQLLSYTVADDRGEALIEVRPIEEMDVPTFGDKSLVIRFEQRVINPSSGVRAEFDYFSGLAVDGDRAMEMYYIQGDGSGTLDEFLAVFSRAFDWQHQAFA